MTDSVIGLLRARFHKAKEEARENGEYGYSFAMLRALEHMARNGVYPDDSFTDEEASVWLMFRS